MKQQSANRLIGLCKGGEDNDELRAQLAAIKAENDNLRKDAERYRWLRNYEVGPSQIWELLSDDCQPPYMTLKAMHDLDAAIDDAMAQGEKG